MVSPATSACEKSFANTSPEVDPKPKDFEKTFETGLSEQIRLLRDPYASKVSSLLRNRPERYESKVFSK